MIRALALSTALLLHAAPVTAHAAEHDPALITLLSMFHEEPSPEQLAGFEPGLFAQLQAVAEDASVRRLARVRALSALGAIGTDAAFAVVSRFAVDERAPVRLRLAALWTVGQRFGTHPAATELLGSALSAEDPGLRESAVRALAQVGTPEAFARLSAHRLAERHALVRGALREARRLELGGATLPRDGVPARARTEVTR